MKLIITEEQLRLIIENEGENLMDFTPFIDIDPSKWDNMFNRLNEKKGGKYDGYYIDGHIDIKNSDIKKFDHLVRVKGHLKANGSKIEDLGKLRRVDGTLTLSNTKNLKSLGNLEYVGFELDLKYSNIESLGHLNQVGRDLDLRFTEKLNSLGEESPKFSGEEIQRGYKIFVGDFLMIYGTSLSDKEIDRIKYNWFSKSMTGHL